jgi:uncharacterized protein (DUF2384 family)
MVPLITNQDLDIACTSLLRQNRIISTEINQLYYFYINHKRGSISMQQSTQFHPENSPAVLSKAVRNTALYLGIPNTKLSRILGLSPATISRLNTGTFLLSADRKEWEFAVLLVRLFRSLDSIVGGSSEAARVWLNSENKALFGRKPVELIETTEGLVHVVTYLDANRGVV